GRSRQRRIPTDHSSAALGAPVTANLLVHAARGEQRQQLPDVLAIFQVAIIARGDLAEEALEDELRDVLLVGRPAGPGGEFAARQVLHAPAKALPELLHRRLIASLEPAEQGGNPLGVLHVRLRPLKTGGRTREL